MGESVLAQVTIWCHRCLLDLEADDAHLISLCDMMDLDLDEQVVEQDVVAILSAISNEKRVIVVDFKILIFLVVLERDAWKSIKEKLIAIALSDHIHKLLLVFPCQDFRAHFDRFQVLHHFVKHRCFVQVVVHLIIADSSSDIVVKLQTIVAQFFFASSIAEVEREVIVRESSLNS